jgi:hypothetical protein
MKRLAVASSKWKVRLQTWSLEFEWSREIRGRIVRWTVANTVAGVTAAGLFWSLDRSWPYAPLPVVALALLAFGAILGASQWLALRGWSSLSKWWLLAAPLAGFGGWLCGLIVGSVTVVTVLVSSGPGAAGWTFILILPVAAGLARLAAGAAQWGLMKLHRPQLSWWLIASAVAGMASGVPWLYALVFINMQTEPIWRPLWRGFAAGLTYGLLSGIGFLRREGQPVEVGGLQPTQQIA